MASGVTSLHGAQRPSRYPASFFVGGSDPVGAGFVESLTRPGGNITGFMQFANEFSGQMAGIAEGDIAKRDAGQRCYATLKYPRG